jgi:hypothetical protein
MASDPRVHLTALAYNEALAVFEANAIAYRALAGKDVDAAAELRDTTCSVLLTATSDNGIDLERRFVAAAKRLGTPSVGVLDFGSNYRRRFDRDGERLVVPDIVAVTDERTRAELVEAGAPASAIRVTGQPAFDALGAVRSRFSAERRRVLRTSLGVADDDLLVLFASQPLKGRYDDQYGFDEESVLADVLRALDRLAPPPGQRLVLLIRPHPRESSEKFDPYAGERASVHVSSAGDRREWVLASDLVVGMNSALLVEACYLRCPVLSVQPGLKVPDPLPTNGLGASRLVRQRQDIGPALESLLFDPAARDALLERAASLASDGHAARNVTGLVYELLGMPPPGPTAPVGSG